ncbi:hypothetical protein HYX12_01000 [Candidatus Woesearchaeota archaeon]|nr:hypothetical protein [Candidatus Woesearchaeota archaeon]
MKAIILGGKNHSQQQWTADLREGLQPHFEEITIQHYAHWGTDKDIDFEEEKKRLQQTLRASKDYALVAKSIGTALATAAISEGAVPQYCIFAGIPLHKDGTSKFYLEEALVNYSVPTLISQNIDERFMNPEQLRNFFARLNWKCMNTLSKRW